MQLSSVLFCVFLAATSVLAAPNPAVNPRPRPTARPAGPRPNVGPRPRPARRDLGNERVLEARAPMPKGGGGHGSNRAYKREFSNARSSRLSRVRDRGHLANGVIPANWKRNIEADLEARDFAEIDELD